MTTTQEALLLAEETLIWANKEINAWIDDAYGHPPEDHEPIMKALAAIREALHEQPAEQEPVAWNDLDEDELAHKLGWRIGDPLYMTIVGIGQEAIHHFKAQNTAPPQREWVSLTDDEIFNCFSGRNGVCVDIARAISAKLKEKNK